MSDDYETDEWLMEVFHGWFDPCPLVPEDELVSNGLYIDWKDFTFVNPPYSNPLPWVEKAIIESSKGRKIVMLLKHDSSTRWYRLLHEYGCRFLMIQGRLQHRTGRSAAFPSVLVVL